MLPPNYHLKQIFRKAFLITAILTCHLKYGLAQEGKNSPHFEVSPAYALSLMQNLQMVKVIDTREHSKFSKGHLPGAISIPAQKMQDLNSIVDHNSWIILYSDDGITASNLCQQLWEMGYKKVINIKEGMKGWKAINLPTIDGSTSRPQPTIPTPNHTKTDALSSSFCPSYGGSTSYEYISNVAFNKLTETTLSITIDVYITNPGNCQYGDPCPAYDDSPEFINAWVDWNGDNVLSSNEKVIDVALNGYQNIGYNGSMSTSTIVSIPANSSGDIWLRANLGWSFDPNDPCETSWSWGNVVDMPLNIASSIPPSISDINITGFPYQNFPITNDPSLQGTEKVKLEAVIDNLEGYEITDISWTGDLTSGKGNPYEYTPGAGTHGNKNVHCNIVYKSLTTNETGTSNFSKSFKLFFNKEGDDDNDGLPNWFEYWKSDGAVPNMTTAKYDADNTGYGYYRTNTNEMFLAPRAAGQHYSSPIVLQTYFGTESFGGSGVTGIDCAAEVIAHESHHGWINNQWNQGGLFYQKQDSDNGLQDPSYNDRLPDFYETETTHTNNDDTDTYDLEHKKSPTYVRYGDNEYAALRAGNGVKGLPQKDWAYPGKQTTSANSSSTKLMISTSIQDNYEPVFATFTGNYSDTGVTSSTNSSFDSLRIIAEVEVESGGTFGLNAVLSNSTEAAITSLNQSIDIAAGTHNLMLDFDGIILSTAGADGPYSVSLLLTNEFGDSLDYQVDAHTTAAYTHTDFAKKEAYLTGSFEDYGIDSDDDTKLDSLNISATIDVLTSGSFIIEAGLYSGVEIIELVSQNIELEQGTHQATIRFTGPTIKSKRLDGPYSLKYINIQGANTSDILVDAYTTQSYAYADFDGLQSSFSNEIDDILEDLNEDDIIDSLGFELTIASEISADYLISGDLYTTDNEFIANTESILSVDEGSTSALIKFAGPVIYDKGLNGPFTLKNLSLIDLSGVLIDLIDSAATTDSLSFYDFEKGPDPLIELTNEFQEYIIDADSNCVNDYLAVEVGLHLSDSGYVVVKALLADKNGQEIDWAESTKFLKEDTIQSIRLNFDGISILENQTDGPFSIKNIYAFHTGDPSKADFNENGYSTIEYSYLNFDTIPGFQINTEQIICEGTSLVFGSQTLTTSGEYVEVFQSLLGCDSTVTLHLNVNPAYTESLEVSICGGETYNFGSQTLSTSGEYTEVFQSSLGCDSTVSLALTVAPLFDEEIETTICFGESYSFGSQTLTASGVYSEVFQSITGCDSTVTLTLEVHEIVTDISIIENTLSVELAEAANYQWIDCDNNTPIENATSHTFTPQSTGHYAVIIEQNECATSSECVEFAVVLGSQKLPEQAISIYPIPAKEVITIDFGVNFSGLCEVVDLTGKVHLQFTVVHKNVIQLENHLAKGIYLIRITSEDGEVTILKISKE